MKYLPLVGLLLAAGCHTDGPSAALQNAVSAHLRRHVAGYQPLRWGPVRAWRQVDEDSLTILRHFAREDSLRTWWRRTYDERGATLSKRYVDSVNHLQDSLMAYRVMLNNRASRRDTTRLGTLLGHTYQRRAAGGLVRDSAQLLVGRHGPVVQLPQLKSPY